MVQSVTTVPRPALPLLLSLAASAGCLDSEDDQVQFAEDFERCGGGCDWVSDGDVTIVTTNHPGEHAARLGAGAAMRHALNIDRELTDPDAYESSMSDGNWIEYSTDCDGRPGLALEPFGPDVQVRLVLAGAPAIELTRRKLMFPALPPGAIPPDDPDDYRGPIVRFRSLAVEADAPCRIDNLRVMVSGGTLGY